MTKDNLDKKMDGASDAPDNVAPFPIVALGSSAGGLEANEVFFKNARPDLGMAYVIITHLEPHHPSLLAEIISKSTTMEAVQVQNGMIVQKDKIYVIPPGKYMMIANGTLQLLDRCIEQEAFLPIDYFLRSLAEDWKENANAAILSGNASDGSIGIRAIHANLGMVMAQSPETAKYDSMPRSAIETGVVDYVLPPEDMPEMITRYVDAISDRVKPPKVERIGSKDGTEKILSIVKAETSHDFSLYKKSTIHRRIERRMAVHQLKDKERYANFLLANPRETHQLFKELIIEVTCFFRNPEAFASLKENLRKSISMSGPGNGFRAWVPACSTGEEAYSIGIILRELMEETGKFFRVQIFGSDINEEAINIARTGDFPLTIADDIDADRLAKYFIRHENGYRVKKEVREMIVFAPHDVNRDPPFLHLDLLACRNLLIYYQPELQRRAIENFGIALNPGGILFLGESETINGYNEQFTALDTKWKIYRRRAYDQAPPAKEVVMQPRKRRGVRPPSSPKVRGPSIGEKVEELLLSEHTPAGLVIDEKNEIIYFHGQIRNYLGPSPGRASLNIGDLLREDIRYPVLSSIDETRSTGRPVFKEGVRANLDDEATFLNLIVKPLETERPVTNILVVFDEIVIPQSILRCDHNMIMIPNTEARFEELEKELRYTKESLRSTIEQLETSNEELTSTNEELQSNNEELQSVAEESETGKEELSSLNEELMTVNSELERKNQELSRTSSDMRNLLNSIDEAIVFLDIDLRIRRFTPLMQKIMNLLPGDIGRPIEDIATKMKYEDLVLDIKNVLDTLNSQEKEIQTNDGHWYKLKILPYRTVENVIDGAVVTFSDIDIQKRAQQDP